MKLQELLIKCVRLLRLIVRENVVLLEYRELDDDFYDVLDELLGLLLAAELLLRQSINVVQKARSRLVDEDFGDVLRGHAAEDFLLCTETNVFRLEGIVGHNCWDEKESERKGKSN